MVARIRNGMLCARRWPRKAWVRALTASAAALLLCSAPALAQQIPDQAAEAQAAAPPQGAETAPTGAGTQKWRFGLPLIDLYSFESHPFFQITNDSSYEGGKAASGSGFSVGERDSDANAGFIIKLIHALPPFLIQTVQPLDLAFPKGIGYEFHHLVFSQSDTEAATGSSTVLPIQTDTYLYGADVKLYAFDPTEPGLNYFVGFEVGWLTGKMIATPFSGQASQTISYSMLPYGATRLGLESKGDNFGVRYELLVMKADSVELDSNPYPAVSNTTINFSGAIVRLAVFYEFD